MAWVTVTLDDLKMYTVAALVDALNTSALGDNQADRFTTIQADVIEEVRSAVASDEKNVLDADETLIPRSLRPAACWLIAQYLAQGLKYKLSDAQLAEVESARQLLRDVASGERSVTMPTTVDPTPDVQGGTAVAIATSETRRWTRESQSGL